MSNEEIRKKAPVTTVTVNRNLIAAPTGNIYLALEIIAKRAEQIQQELNEQFKEETDPYRVQEEIKEAIQEFSEDEELIRISRYYEKLPKPWALALQEWLEGKIKWSFQDDEGNEIENKIF